MRTKALILTLLALAAPAAAQEPRKVPDLPADVAAIVHGEVIPMERFRALLVQRFGPAEEGKQALDNLVERILVEEEQRRRGVTVSDEELEAYLATVARQVTRHSAGTQSLEELLEEKGVTREEFEKVSRDFLVRTKLAAAYLGKEPEDVKQYELGVWLEGLKQKRGVVIGSPPLPAGTLAKVGDRTVTVADLGVELLDSLDDSTLEGALWDLVIARAVQQRLDEGGIEVDEADVDRAVMELEEEFRADPRFRQTSFTFEQYVRTVRRLTLDELRADPLFLAQIGLAKQIRNGLSMNDVKAYWEEHRERYGEERTFVHLLVKADDRDSPFGRRSRTFEEAKEIIDALYVRFLRGTSFEKLVAEASEDRSSTSRPDRRIVINRETPLPDSLKTRIFSSPPGEVVGPVRSPYGYHLLKVVEVKPELPFEGVRERAIRDLVREQRTRELLEVRQDKEILLRY